MAIYLRKDNNDLVSTCACTGTLIAPPEFDDRPWDGSGWLFTCTKCRGAFTFARAVEVAMDLDEVLELDATACLMATGYDPTYDDDHARLELMQQLLAHVRAGEQYIYFDGVVAPANSRRLIVEGIHRYHELVFVPQVRAMDHQDIRDDLLENEAYWKDEGNWLRFSFAQR